MDLAQNLIFFEPLARFNVLRFYYQRFQFRGGWWGSEDGGTSMER
jgi:hypothetical protein